MDVVEATESHLAALGAFFREAWRMTGPGSPGWSGADEEVVDDLAQPSTLRDRIGGPERRMFLALDGDRVVGFAATRWTGDGPAELAGIVVLQELVGRGIGTPLLSAALDRLGADGATEVFVRTEVDNERALAFYRARGFVDAGDLDEDVEGTTVRVTELRRPIDRALHD